MPVRKRTYERAGKKWTRFVAVVMTPSGRRERSFRLEREAKAWESRQRAMIEDRSSTGARTPRLADHLDLWLEQGTNRARDPWAVSTRVDYESAVRVHLKPKLGHIRLEDLTVGHVEAMLQTIPGNRARIVRAVLSGALTMAVKHRQLSYNVAQLAELKVKEKPPIKPLTSTEAKAFLAAVSRHRLSALFAVTTALALRQSEAIGLRWQDVDLDARMLRIEQRTHYKAGAFHTGQPKSPKSRRTIHFPEEIADILREHKTRTLREQLGAKQWTDHGLVFPNTSGGPLYGDYVTRTMQRIMKEAGLEPRRFHDLRHTGASILHALGVDLKTIQAVLGHADYRLTADTYTHAEDTVLKDAASKMGTFLRG